MSFKTHPAEILATSSASVSNAHSPVFSTQTSIFQASSSAPAAAMVTLTPPIRSDDLVNCISLTSTPTGVGPPIVKKVPSQQSMSRMLVHQHSQSSCSQQQQPGILKCVSEKIRKTKAELNRSGCIHAFYIFGLVLYSAVGGLIFRTLDGKESDEVLDAYKNRCVNTRTMVLANLSRICVNFTFVECQQQIEHSFTRLYDCMKEYDTRSHQITMYSTADYTNAVIYSITVFSTIGYGTISMSSTAGRVATIIYTLVGIPLFFAFLNDVGQWFQRLFLHFYFRLRRMLRNRFRYSACCNGKSNGPTAAECIIRRSTTPELIENGSFKNKPTSDHIIMKTGEIVDANQNHSSYVVSSNDVQPSLPNFLCKKTNKKVKKQWLSSTVDKKNGHSKQSLIFTCAIIFLLLYFLLVSYIFSVLAEWDLFVSVYFLFQSISLIGFGDFFPSKPRVVLFTIIFIIIGISLLSMCFFILQEWIREKTCKLSRRVRCSVRHYWRPIRTLSSGYYSKHLARHNKLCNNSNSNNHRVSVDATVESTHDDNACRTRRQTIPRRLKSFPPMRQTTVDEIKDNNVKLCNGQVVCASQHTPVQHIDESSCSSPTDPKSATSTTTTEPGVDSQPADHDSKLEEAADKGSKIDENSTKNRTMRKKVNFKPPLLRTKTYFWVRGKAANKFSFKNKKSTFGNAVVAGRFQMVPPVDKYDQSDDDDVDESSLEDNNEPQPSEHIGAG